MGSSSNTSKTSAAKMEEKNKKQNKFIEEDGVKMKFIMKQSRISKKIDITHLKRPKYK